MTAPDHATPSAPYVRWVLLVFALVFSVAGTVRVAPRLALWAQRDSLQRVTGTVAASDVRSHGGRDYETARVVVRYEVHGDAHALRTSGADGLAIAAASPAAFVARYPAGAQTSVYVSPDDPSLASLTRDIDPTTDLAMLIFLWLTAAALVASLWAHGSRRRRQENGVHIAPAAPRA